MLKGIDVSHNNGVIDWTSISPDISFVFIKQTQGKTFKDPLFQANWTAVKTKGIIHGAYHFLTFQDTAQDQVNNFLSHGIDFSLENVLPPVLDVEWQVPDTLNRYILQNRTKCIQLIQDWLTEVEQKTNRTPIIYTGKSFWNEYLGGPSGFEKYPLWIPAYQSQNPGLPPGWDTYTFWQFSESGTINSPTGGGVDWSYFNGDINELKTIANFK